VPEHDTTVLRLLRRWFPGSFATSAYAVAERACHLDGERGDRLFARACGRFRNLHQANPRYIPALKLWGAALERRAPRLRSPEAERTRAEAEEMLSLALELNPNDPDTLAALASVLERRAWLKPPEVAGPLLARARHLAGKGLSLRPHHSHLLNVSAFVLYGQAHALPEEDLDRRLAEALDIFKSEYRTTPTASILTGWGTVLFAQADRTSGTDAERLLREAKGKYEAVLARDPTSSTYNLACVCARLGEFDECRRWLERSGEPGRLATREEVAADPELSAVRDCAWFRLLLAE
jgi:tetratricopeptide (TPR) repeat protein